MTMADIEESYRSLIHCINEQRWQHLPRYMHAHVVKNGQDITPESYAAEIKSLGGKVEVIADALTVDRESRQRLGATVLVKFTPAGTKEGAEVIGRTISFMEQHFVWFTEGKVSKILTLADRDEMQRQLSNPQASYDADLISHEPPPSTSSGAKLSARELEERYRAYIGCINAQAMETDLHKFCHAQVIHNTRTLTVDEYRLLIQEAFTAIPDIAFDLHTVVADEQAQRVAARIEFAGTPVGIMAGAKPNGGGVSFCEHVTYRFDGGRIARVWSIVDWTSYRAQLAQQQ
ncbi:SnoaL-domain-containing protein [Hypoxylon sp. FL0543]|nr:SnoaL-domain-containing protein [Hypoxylon sp. FL0543]